MAEALVRFGRHWRDMEKALESRNWLAGDQFTLADAGLISFFYRMEMMHADLWTDNFPRVAGWFERCKARPSFTAAIGNYVTPETRANFDAASIPLTSEVKAAFGEAMAVIGRD